MLRNMLQRLARKAIRLITDAITESARYGHFEVRRHFAEPRGTDGPRCCSSCRTASSLPAQRGESDLVHRLSFEALKRSCPLADTAFDEYSLSGLPPRSPNEFASRAKLCQRLQMGAAGLCDCLPR